MYWCSKLSSMSNHENCFRDVHNDNNKKINILKELNSYLVPPLFYHELCWKKKNIKYHLLFFFLTLALVENFPQVIYFHYLSLSSLQL